MADIGPMNAQLGADLAQGPALGVQVGSTLNVHGATVTTLLPGLILGQNHDVIDPDGRPDPRQAGEMLVDDAQATFRGEPLPDRDPLRRLAELRALRDNGAISAAEFEIRKSAIRRDI
jgi:hypothetical protein